MLKPQWTPKNFSWVPRKISNWYWMRRYSLIYFGLISFVTATNRTIVTIIFQFPVCLLVGFAVSICDAYNQNVVPKRVRIILLVGLFFTIFIGSIASYHGLFFTKCNIKITDYFSGNTIIISVVNTMRSLSITILLFIAKYCKNSMFRQNEFVMLKKISSLKKYSIIHEYSSSKDVCLLTTGNFHPQHTPFFSQPQHPIHLFFWFFGIEIIIFVEKNHKTHFKF